MPEITPLNTGYELTYAEHDVVIRVSRLDVHKDGHVTAFIKIISKVKDKAITLLPSAQFNLSAPRTRSELAKNLTEKRGDVPWRDVIDYLCREIQERAWVGEPGEVLQVSDESEVVHPSYLLEPVVMKGVPSVIFGEKGVHKTILSLLFCICIELPWQDNPYGLTTNTHLTRIAMLDWESDRDLTMFNLQRLLRGAGQTYAELNYRRCNRPLTDDLEQISNFLDDKECDFILIDSLGAASGGKLNDPEPALKFFEALRILGRTSLLIAQTSKNEDGTKTIFGSTYFQYYSRNIFELRKSIDTMGRDETKVALFHQIGNYSGTHDPIGFRLHFSADTISVTREELQTGEFLERVNRQKMILELLRDGPMTTMQLAEKCQTSEGNVRITMKRLADKNLAQRTEKGAWGLSVRGAETMLA